MFILLHSCLILGCFALLIGIYALVLCYCWSWTVGDVNVNVNVMTETVERLREDVTAPSPRHSAQRTLCRSGSHTHTYMIYIYICFANCNLSVPHKPTKLFTV
jgi:hypothetical protein